MLIFLDSNILCTNFYMRGPSFETMQKVGTIVFGQIVVDEVCNKYREMLEEQVQKLQRGVNDLNRMISSSVDISLDTLIESECEKYRDFLDVFIIESGMTVAEDYPQNPHEQIVKRALQRKKPFKADGSTGYRDYLVWLTCLDVAQLYSNEDIHFITSNIRDFSDLSDKDKLHPDLLEDIKARGIQESRFHYWNSVKDFIDRCATERAKQIEERERIVSEIEGNKEGFCQPIQKFIDELPADMDLSGFDVLVPGEKARLKQVEDLSEFNIDDIADINETEYLLDVCIDGFGIIDSYSNMSEVKEYEECEFEFDILRCDENNECILRTMMGIQVHLRAIYNKKLKVISSIELDYIDDYNCPFCD